MARAAVGSEPAGAPTGSGSPVVDTTFTSAVSAITDAFGDPTRRRIYLFVRDHVADAGEDGDGEQGVTAATVAAEVGIHPNVARHHLDKLAAGGYVEVVARTRPVAGRKAGRPSKYYVAVKSDAAGDLPVHTEDLVLALLGQALARLPRVEAEAMAEDVGASYGRTLAARLTGDSLAAGQRSLRSAMQSVAAALTAHGFAARTSEVARRGAADGLRIISDHCPFGNVAIEHPVLCAVDRGMVRGMLGVLYTSADSLAVVTEASKAHGDTLCATSV